MTLRERAEALGLRRACNYRGISEWYLQDARRDYTFDAVAWQAADRSGWLCGPPGGAVMFGTEDEALAAALDRREHVLS